MDENALVPLSPETALQQAGRIADEAARGSLFADFQEGVAKNTKQSHRFDVAKFAEYLTAAGIPVPDRMEHDLTAWRNITWGIVKGFVRWQMDQGCAIASVNRRLSTVKKYLALAYQAGHISAEAHEMIRLVKGYGRKTAEHADESRPVTRSGDKKAQPTGISDEDAEQLKRQPDTLQGRRDAFMLCLLIDHGLRVGEVALLQVEHFDLSRRLLTFRRPKVGITQKHRLSADTFVAATAYLYGGGPKSGPLWYCTNKQGQIITSIRRDGQDIPCRFSERAMQDRVEYLGRTQIGIENLSPHDLRHYWATAAIEAGTDIKALQDAGGWSSPIMPLRYAKSSEIANERVKTKTRKDVA
jgi:integrase